jgi:hypothetical protein
MTDQEMTAREVLTAVLDQLKNQAQIPQILLDPSVRTEMANDSDWHRTRIGYMGYDSVIVISVNGQNWALGLGKACGAYPADPYDCDIIALPVDPTGKDVAQLRAEISALIEESTHFRNSLVYVLDGGDFATSQNARLGLKLVERIKPIFSDFIVQSPEYKEGILHLDLRPVIQKAYRYKPSLVEFMTQSILHVLAQS